jgi:peptidoglycan hydrolase CwlO-like protein
MSIIQDFENARQTAEAIRLFLERIGAAELVCRRAIEAQQFLDAFGATRARLEEEQAALQASRNELEQDLADLQREKAQKLEAFVAEGSQGLQARVAGLKDAIATLEQEKLHAAAAFDQEQTAYAQRIAELMAEEDRLAKLCQKHRSQLGKIRAEVLRVMDDEEEG